MASSPTTLSSRTKSARGGNLTGFRHVAVCLFGTGPVRPDGGTGVQQLFRWWQQLPPAVVHGVPFPLWAAGCSGSGHGRPLWPGLRSLRPWRRSDDGPRAVLRRGDDAGWHGYAGGPPGHRRPRHLQLIPVGIPLPPVTRRLRRPRVGPVLHSVCSLPIRAARHRGERCSAGGGNPASRAIYFGAPA